MKWQDGLNLCLDNAVELKKSCEIMCKLGKLHHTFFFYFTALEELGTASFILNRFNNPAPSQLKRLLKHPRKLSYVLSQ